MMVDSFGDKLKKLRLEKKLRQEQVAELIGVNKKQISAYETDARQPSLDTVCRLARLYKVTTDYLLDCNAKKVLDVSGLTADEYRNISELVDDMSKKNKRLQEKEDEWG